PSATPTSTGAASVLPAPCASTTVHAGAAVAGSVRTPETAPPSSASAKRRASCRTDPAAASASDAGGDRRVGAALEQGAHLGGELRAARLVLVLEVHEDVGPAGGRLLDALRPGGELGILVRRLAETEVAER